jgi:NhaP-type Na+/H+ or K+/H+ antiporter
MSNRDKSVTKIYAGYLGLRLLLFFVALAICIVVGLSGLWAVVIALVVSGVVAYPLARRQRDDIVRALNRGQNRAQDQAQNRRRSK